MTEHRRRTTERTDAQELQSLADERRLEFIFERLAELRDEEETAYLAASFPYEERPLRRAPRMIRELIERARAVPIDEEVARRGIKLRGGIDRCGPCPECGGTDRFSINIKKQCFFCRGCQVGGDVITMVRHLDGCDFATAIATLTGGEVQMRAAAPARKKTAEDYERKQHQTAGWLWSRRKPIAGSIAETYLRARCITCPLPPTLAFLPPTKPEHHPAMIAAFALVDEPEPGILGEPRNVQAVHLTLLKPDGSGKADVEKPKIVIGSPGAQPIVIAPPNDLLGLAICEGIEDALTVHQATGLGIWVAGSAGRMPALANLVPTYIECVTIYAHADEAGQDGALQLAQALDRRFEVIIEGLR
jgi:hypothetical protein